MIQPLYHHYLITISIFLPIGEVDLHGYIMSKEEESIDHIIQSAEKALGAKLPVKWVLSSGLNKPETIEMVQSIFRKEHPKANKAWDNTKKAKIMVLQMGTNYHNSPDNQALLAVH